MLVIDLSSLWAGPLCGQLLAEAGARVIKIESVSRPDPVRQAAPVLFDRLHARKESVALDFREAGDLERLRTLLLRADVVISSARPRAFVQLGLEPASIFAGNPSLVWVAITGHGWTGEGCNAVGFGDDAAAAAGLVAHDGAGRPLFAGDALADPLTGLAAAGGALEAIGRGGGLLVDASLVGAAGFVASFAGPSDAGLVFSEGSAWRVRSGDVTADVAAAEARPTRGSARPFGADTTTVLGTLA
jgi:crotonobetainyl-CoA:carnitine CoA-transferase CaiB-like acyl-CoA transferase